MDKLDELQDLIQEAGRLALLEQKRLTVNKKKDTSIVSNGDLVVSKFLEIELAKLFPDHSVFSEENTNNLPTTSKVIIIDPIDGTESYVRGESTWSILIGFLDEMKPVGGMIYQPTENLLYYGFQGQGAFCVSDSGTEKLVADRTGALKGLKSKKDYGESALFKELNIHEVEEMYSAALKIMKVAKGEADAYLNFRKQCSLWDLVAPDAILREAGGRIVYRELLERDFKNPKVDVDFFVAGKRLWATQFSFMTIPANQGR